MAVLRSPTPAGPIPILGAFLLGILLGCALTLGFRGTGRVLSREQPPPPTGSLAAALGPLRLTEGRLRHLKAHAPYPTPLAATKRPDLDRLLRRHASSSSSQLGPRGAQADALSHVLLGRLDSAIDTLEAAVRTEPRAADLLSDLSALYGERARASNRPRDHLSALVKSDRAVTLAPQVPEHLFNHALALEHLSLWEESRDVWRRYLATESRSPRAMEARQHLRTIGAALQTNISVRAKPRISGSVAEEPWANLDGLELERWVEALIQGERKQVERWLEDPHRMEEVTSRGAKVPRDVILLYQQALFRYHSGDPAGAEAILYRLARNPRLEEYPGLDSRRYALAGMLAQLEGRQADALLAFRAARRRSADAGDELLTATIDLLIAECLMSLGQPTEAWSHLYQALTSASTHPAGRQLYSALDSAVLAALWWGHPEVALHFQTRLVRLTERVPGPGVLFSRLRRARIQTAICRTDEADRDFKEVLARLPAVPPDIRRALASEIGATSVEIEDSRSRAPTLGHKLKAGFASLFASLRERADPGPRRVDLAALEEQLLRAFEERRARITPGAYRMSFLDLARDHYESLIAMQLREPERALEILEHFRSRALLDRLQELSGRGLEAAASRTVAPLDRRELCRRLPDRTVVVVYAVIHGRLVTWLVRQEGIEHSWERPLWAGISSLVKRFDASPQGRSASWDALARLYRALVEPWRAEIDPGDRLVFVPTHSLYRLPFAALRDPSSGRFLIEDHAIGIAPSVSEFVAAVERDRHLAAAPPAGVLLAGDAATPRAPGVLSRPLLGAAREIDGLHGLYRGADVRVFRREQATPARVLAALPAAGIAHFAAHAREDLEDPSRSAVVLSGPGGKAGLLMAGDILHLRLPRTRLVMLAACETQSGPISPSEGPQSIAAAFLGAGVPAVVASLWPVGDRATARISLRFHQELRRGADALTALRAAQLPEITSDSFDWSWASFQVIGGVSERLPDVQSSEDRNAAR